MHKGGTDWRMLTPSEATPTIRTNLSLRLGASFVRAGRCWPTLPVGLRGVLGAQQACGDPCDASKSLFFWLLFLLLKMRQWIETFRCDGWISVAHTDPPCVCFSWRYFLGCVNLAFSTSTYWLTTGEKSHCGLSPQAPHTFFFLSWFYYYRLWLYSFE